MTARPGRRGGLAGRVYALLLRAYPRAFRGRHGAAMRDLFLEKRDEVRRRGPRRGRGRFWMETLSDVARNAAAERIVARGRVPTSRRLATAALGSLAEDVRYAARRLRYEPGFTAVALLTLALGIGANTAIFSIVDAMLLRPLAVREPDRLVLVTQPFPYPVWEQIRDRHLLGRALGWSSARFDTAAGGPAEFVDGAWVSGGAFEVLGVPPVLGRTLTQADDWPGGGPDGPVAVISYRFWQRRFGGAPDVLGRPLIVDRVPFTIVGVLPRTFNGLEAGLSFDVALPLGAATLTAGRSQLGPFGLWIDVIARLRDGQTVEEATAALGAAQPLVRAATMPPFVYAADRDEYMKEPLAVTAAPAGMSPWRWRYERPLLVLLTLVAIVLLVACGNIASLLLARATARQRELSLRVALGASRWRLARQLLVESLLLAAPAAILALMFAQWASRFLVAQFSTEAYTVFFDLTPDWRVLAFTAGVGMGTGLLFGTVPALRASRAAPVEALERRSPTIAGDRRSGTLGALVVGQVALSLVLVVAAGLFVRTLTTLATVDLGFDRDRVLIVGVDATHSAATSGDRAALYERLRDAADAVPGVASAAASAAMPLGNMRLTPMVAVPGMPPMSASNRFLYGNTVTPGWFATMGLQIRAGRDFDSRDRQGAPRVAIVDEAFARRFFGGANPVGRTIQEIEGPDERQALEIVGLVSNAIYPSLRETPPPTLYVPVAQAVDVPEMAFNLIVRPAAEPPARLSHSVANAVGRVDPDLTLTFRTLTDQVNASFRQQRLVALLGGFFGALALLLAAVGLFGVTAYGVNRRRAEIGIRLALGAEPASVVRLVVGRAARLVAVGAMAGLVASLWGARFVASLLFGVEPRDAATLAASAGLLLAVAAVAAWVPARRAARIDPSQVLREG